MIRLMMNRNLSMASADEIGQISLVKNALKEFKIVMNRHNMKRYIQHACDNIFTLIREETENSLVSLMFDSASRYGRNVFGVSCRYIKDGQIADRTFGIITQEGRQFGEILAAQLENVIGKIGKCANDIYATCTDQGKNMMKASNILQNAQNQMKVILEIYGDEFIDFKDEEIDIGALENEEGNYSEAHTVCVEKSVGSFCSAMFCGAHVCQLAAKDITSMFEDALNNIRKVAIESKKVAYIQTFKNLKKPRIDIEPRWDSTFLMTENFHTNAEAYQRLRHDQLKLNDASWSLIDEYFDTFLPIHSAMMDFQSAKLSMSEFYVRWIKMKIEIENVPAGDLGLKMLLTNAIYTREQVFLKCEAFIAALVLDPRFCFTSGHQLFNTEMLNRGIIQLIKIHQKLEQSSLNISTRTIKFFINRRIHTIKCVIFIKYF